MGVLTRPLIPRIARRLRRSARHAWQVIASLPDRCRERRPPVPPPWLLHRIGGSCDARWFLESGRAAAAVVREALARQGRELANCQRVLDFGCGVGRVLRHWSNVTGPQFFGTDFNPSLIRWCERHLPFCQFNVNTLEPTLPYAAETFDLIYAFSVFTHLTPSLQQAWIAELARVLKPGGLLLISLHGEYYMPQLDEQQRERFRSGLAVVVGSEREGFNDCAAFHPEPYVRIVLARDWQVVDHQREGARGNPNQDLYILRKPAGSDAMVA